MNESTLFAKASEKRVLFIGETIIDVYHYVRPLGRPLKESIVSVEHIYTEEFKGGVVAAAEHAKDFCAEAQVYSTGHPIIKERWVEASHVRKLFEVYRNGNQGAYSPVCDITDFDAVIVTDYGHGMMDDLLPELRKARFLCVNVQTNSGNFGFNLATKYRNLVPQYLVVDEPEARLATCNKNGPITDSLRELSKFAATVIVTMGKQGAIGIDGKGIREAPAFVDKVVDTIGAGDAFFAVTSLVAEEANMEELLRIGNAAGAVKTGIVGHRQRVTKDAVEAALGRFREGSAEGAKQHDLRREADAGSIAPV